MHITYKLLLAQRHIGRGEKKSQILPQAQALLTKHFLTRHKENAHQTIKLTRGNPNMLPVTQKCKFKTFSSTLNCSGEKREERKKTNQPTTTTKTTKKQHKTTPQEKKKNTKLLIICHQLTEFKIIILTAIKNYRLFTNKQKSTLACFHYHIWKMIHRMKGKRKKKKKSI